MEKYIIKNNKTGEYIAIDQASGGYPYDTDIFNAKIWHTKQEAREYNKMSFNHDWSLCIIKINEISTT